MKYQTFEPAEDISMFINCFWTLESPKEAVPEIQTIVPDCSMEMIFHYGDLYRQFKHDGKSIIQPRCFVIGQLTRPLAIQATGETGIFSVRFQPNGFIPFATMPIKEMENTAISLEKMYGLAGIEIESMVLNARSNSERIELVTAFLLNRWAAAIDMDNIVKSNIETILTANGTLSIKELSSKTNTNRRKLERKFLTAIGLSPKQLSKTIRLQATLKMMLNKKFTSLTALAYENEYYDQAHFIKDFKELTGFTPKEFYGDNLKMSSLFYSKN